MVDVTDPVTIERAELMRCRCGRATIFRAESFVCPGCGFDSERCECEVVGEEG